MQRIVITEKIDTMLNIRDVRENEPVFAKHHGLLVGMIVKEDKGWILMLGGPVGSTGYHKTFRECFNTALHHGYTFYVDRAIK